MPPSIVGEGRAPVLCLCSRHKVGQFFWGQLVVGFCAVSGCVRAPAVGRYICRPTKRLNLDQDLDDRRAMPRISPIDQSKPGLGPGVLLRGWGWRVGGRPYSRSIRMAFAICTHSYSLDTRLGMEAIMYESFAHSPGPPVHAADHSTIRDVGVLFLSTLCLHSAPNQAKNVRMHKFPRMTAYSLVYSNIFAWGPIFVLGVVIISLKIY